MEVVLHYFPGSEKELDSFLSKAKLGDILSYVPDITKARTEDKSKTNLRYNPCKDWKGELLLFMVLAWKCKAEKGCQ